MGQYVLSVDIGTSSVRARLYDAQGKPQKGMASQIPYSMTTTPAGGAFIDAQAMLEMAEKVIDDVLGKIDPCAMSIEAVAMCTFWHNILGVDAAGQPATPLLSWNDTRPEAVLGELQNSITPEEFAQRTGCPMHGSYVPAKILWMHRAEPAMAKQVRYWMSLGEYLFFRFFGERICSVSMASASGLLHSATCQWDEKILNAIPATPEQFSTLQTQPAGLQGLRAEFATRWPALAGIPWFPALGDGACSNVGCGCSSLERITLMVGTSGAMRMAWEGDFHAPPPGLWCYRIDAKRPIQGGALSNGGNVFQWMTRSLQLPSLADLEADLAAMKPDGHGLTVLPFFAGQRSPNWNANSTATIHGLRLSTGPADILRASLEAIAYRFAMIHKLLEPLLIKDHVIVASGGGLLHSKTWVRIMADVIGRKVCISQVEEASCRGAALYALEQTGAMETIAEADPHLGAFFEPDLDAHRIYKKAL
ncbi:carbohydrate kinase, partial [bacterium]|nr:carbohydrate kinase [bacterium]